MSHSPLNVLLVGTGNIAGTHASRFAAIDGVSVLAAVDIDADRVQQFCQGHGIEYAYQDLDEALSRHRFDAVSVATPDAHHASVSIKALENGLPVLCEKPLSDSVDSAASMVQAAQKADVLTMVNLSYRVSGALAQARAWVDEGRLGALRHVEASYRQSWLVSDYWGDWKTTDAWLWRLSSEHGSLGALGDVGIHILDFVCAGTGEDIAGLQCRLQTFNKAPDNRIGAYTLDANDSCVMNVELSSGAIGVVHLSRYYTGYMNDLELSIHGTQGAVRVSTGQNGDRLQACIDDDVPAQVWREVECQNQEDTFARFVQALQTGGRSTPDFVHAAKLQHYLECGFESHDRRCWVDCTT